MSASLGCYAIRGRAPRRPMCRDANDENESPVECFSGLLTEASRCRQNNTSRIE